MTKFLKISLIILLSLLITALIPLFIFAVITKDAHLDVNKLISPSHNIIIIDENGNEVISASTSNKNKSVDIDELPENCKNAFIASEDRTFYSHNGLNYKRMIKAFFKNIAARSFKEGASTISQQLIKNTHLSNDKTIKRKLNEIKLTKKLEKRFEKDEILEMYLNTIYFGHNCYGLQSAAEFYFDKNAEALTLEESATLVGLLTSPNNYSPFKNPEKSLKRRNTVLKCMLECNFIDSQTYEKTIAKPLNAVMPKSCGKNADYIHAIFDEIEALDINAYDLTEGCTVKTYLDTDLQNFIENLSFNCDNSVIITTKSGGISAYKSTIGGAKRQPGSTVKPIFVYAPAIEEKILSPDTKINDEKIDYNGYCPENFDKKYHGAVSVTESIKNSYNIPAVKTLNTLTVEKAEKYMQKAGFSFENDEKNLSLALGGMKYGLNLKSIADLYSVFSKGGVYSSSAFIKEITTKDGKIIYKHFPSTSRVYSEGTSSLMNEMLIETSLSGTAKKLRNFNFDVASKTGTCGTVEGNTDAYSISYTSEHCIGVWLGDKNNNRLNITGGGSCTGYAKEILSKIYISRTPTALDTTSGTEQIIIDAEEYEKNNRIIIADPFSPKLNNKTIKVLKNNSPKEISSRFSCPKIEKPVLSVKDNTVNIQLCQTKYYAYLIKRRFQGKNEEIYDGVWKNEITDKPKAGTYIYSVTPYFINGDKKIYGEEIILPQVYISDGAAPPQIKIPDIANKDWYNL